MPHPPSTLPPMVPGSASDCTPIRTAAMPHRPSDVDLSTVSLPPPPSEIGHQVDDRINNADYAARRPYGDPRDDAERCRVLSSVLHSPATRLPPEILMHIFELYVAFRRELASFILAQGPFRLMQVCKLWRAVAELDPRLWASIDIYFPESCQHQGEDAPRVKAVLNLYLKRSAALPISLTYTDHREWHKPTEDGIISILADHLRTYSRRWKSITLHMSGFYFLNLFAFTSCDLACLERLSITCDVTTPHIRFPPLKLESAPNLKSFAYSGPNQLLIHDVQLHWDGLTDVSFDFAPRSQPRSMLSRNIGMLARCQNITACSLGVNDSFQGTQPPSQILLPNLRTLHVRRLANIVHVHPAIDPLVLPQLQTLKIDACHHDPCRGWLPFRQNRDFSGLLARSRCTLRHLSIQDVEFPNDEVVRCLALSPTLTSFRLIPNRRSHNMGDVIRKLNVSYTAAGVLNRSGVVDTGHGEQADAGILVPQLREIALASSVEEYLELTMEMFRSRSGADARAAGVASLRRVEVVFFDMSHGTCMAADRDGVPGVRLAKLARFRRDLAQWASKNENGMEGEEGLEASVVLESPYHPEYIDVR